MTIKTILWTAVQMVSLGLCIGAIGEMLKAGLVDSAVTTTLLLLAVIIQAVQIALLERKLKELS